MNRQILRTRCGRSIVRAAALSAVAALPCASRADYIYTGPNNANWSDLGTMSNPNWTYVHADTGVTPPNYHDPMTFYPGATGTDLTITTNINNGIANSNLNFNLDSAVAHIGRFYIGSNNQGPGSSDPYWGTTYPFGTLQPQQLTIQSGSLLVDSTQFSIIGRHTNGKIIQTGGTFDTGQVLRFNDATAGTTASYEYHGGDLISGLGFTGSNPGIRLGTGSGTSGTMVIYNDSPGHIHVKSYYSATAKASSGGFANIGLTEFHFKNSTVKTVRVGDASGGANQVSLRNDKDNPATNYSSQLNFVLDESPAVDPDGVPNNLALFSTPSVTTGGGTDYAVFYKAGGTTGRYLDRDSTYDGAGGRAYDPASDSYVVTSTRAGVNYMWDITYSGKATWDGGFDNITSVTGHGTGTDIVLMGRGSYTGSVWSNTSSDTWAPSDNWTGGSPNGVGAGANFFSAATAPLTVTVTAPVTVGAIQFDNANKYTIDGTSPITVAVASGSGFIRDISGSHAIDAPLNLASNTRISVTPAGNTLSLSRLQPSNITITKSGSGTLKVNNITTTNLVVSAGKVQVSANGGDTGVSYVKSLSIDPAAALDLNDNDLVVEYSTNVSPFNDVRDLVFNGYSSSVDPSKTGIISSTGQTAGNTILAVIDNAFVGATDWPIGSGRTIDSNSIIGKYTYFGDMDLSGDVTADDYGILDANLGTTPPPGIAWVSGDADLSGDITPDDYGILDANFGSGIGSPLAPAAASSAVPEPGVLSLFALLAPALRCRRCARR